MSDQKEMKLVAAGEPAMEKLFEAFDEQWKDSSNPLGSENHFGLINLEAQAKYALWKMVDQGFFKGLTRDGKPITKTYNGNEKA